MGRKRDVKERKEKGAPAAEMTGVFWIGAVGVKKNSSGEKRIKRGMRRSKGEREVRRNGPPRETIKPRG